MKVKKCVVKICRESKEIICNWCWDSLGSIIKHKKRTKQGLIIDIPAKGLLTFLMDFSVFGLLHLALGNISDKR